MCGCAKKKAPESEYSLGKLIDAVRLGFHNRVDEAQAKGGFTPNGILQEASIHRVNNVLGALRQEYGHIDLAPAGNERSAQIFMAVTALEELKSTMDSLESVANWTDEDEAQVIATLATVGPCPELR